MRLLTRAEEFVLLAVWRLQDDAYSIPISRQISDITGKKWSLGAVYMPLERLVKKGMLDSYLSDSTPERGGRHRRIYRLTRSGKQALIEIRQVEQKMWAGLPALTTDTP